eukprot:9894148-Heterocapsa_arctica.AAC.1
MSFGLLGPLVATGTKPCRESRIPGSSPCAAGTNLRRFETQGGAAGGGCALVFASLARRAGALPG